MCCYCYHSTFYCMYALHIKTKIKVHYICFCAFIEIERFSNRFFWLVALTEIQSFNRAYPRRDVCVVTLGRGFIADLDWHERHELKQTSVPKPKPLPFLNSRRRRQEQNELVCVEVFFLSSWGMIVEASFASIMIENFKIYPSQDFSRKQLDLSAAETPTLEVENRAKDK